MVDKENSDQNIIETKNKRPYDVSHNLILFSFWKKIERK